MSHYTVAVFHRKDQDIEELLAPYSENLEVEPYISFTKQEAIDYARKHYQDTEDKTDGECWQMVADGSQTDADGNIYSTYNPKSKWDWWTEGGRWCGMLKTGRQHKDSAMVRNIDFSMDRNAYEEALRFWDVAIDHKPADEGEEYGTFFTEEYYRDYYGDRETYARHQAQFSTFAVITPDGE